jgi:hypothetical protein
VEEIKEENVECAESHYFDNVSGSYVGSNNNYCNIPEYLLENQQEYIKMLKQKISDLEGKLNQHR